jgi:F-type H+-transporting ATPase subunit delta
VISVTLGRRYARALLSLAQKQNEVARTEQELAAVAQLFRRDPRARRFFETPNISHEEKTRFLEERLMPRVGRPLYGLFHVLLRRRRLDHLVVIADEFVKLAEKAQGITHAVVRTAAPITDAQADQLTQVLMRRTGGTIQLTREVDPSLLGGAAVSLDHKVIDGTLATELRRIRRVLLQARIHGRG